MEQVLLCELIKGSDSTRDGGEGGEGTLLIPEEQKRIKEKEYNRVKKENIRNRAENLKYKLYETFIRLILYMVAQQPNQSKEVIHIADEDVDSDELQFDRDYKEDTRLKDAIEKLSKIQDGDDFESPLLLAETKISAIESFFYPERAKKRSKKRKVTINIFFHELVTK